MSKKNFFYCLIACLLASATQAQLIYSDDFEPPSVNGFFSGLPTWRQFDPLPPGLAEPEDDPNGENQFNVSNTSFPIDFFDAGADGNDYACTRTEQAASRVLDVLVPFGSNAPVLWLGGLIQGNSYTSDLGTLLEAPIRERAPLRISIDLSTADNTRIVANPSLTTVQAAIGDLIETAQNAGVSAGSSASFRQTEAYSLEQSSLALGLSASFLRADFDIDIASRNSVGRHSRMAFLRQRLFTISIELPSQPGDLFSDELSAEQLNTQYANAVGPDNPPLYIASIDYGRILVYVMTATASESDLEIAANASYNGLVNLEASLQTRIRNILSTSSIEITQIGGSQNNIQSLIRNGNLGDYELENVALTEARPISYRLNSLSSRDLNTPARTTESTDYTAETCELQPPTAFSITFNRAVTDDEGRVYVNDFNTVRFTHSQTAPKDTYNIPAMLLTPGVNKLRIDAWNGPCQNWGLDFTIRSVRSGSVLATAQGRQGGFRAGFSCGIEYRWEYDINTFDGSIRLTNEQFTPPQ